MARVTIAEPHLLWAAEARRRMDQYFGELAGSSFPGLTIDDVHKAWNGSRLEASFKAKKGFLSKRIEGAVQVEESSVTLDVEVPDLLFSFVSRQEVEGVIRQRLKQKLA